MIFFSSTTSFLLTRVSHNAAGSIFTLHNKMLFLTSLNLNSLLIYHPKSTKKKSCFVTIIYKFFIYYVSQQQQQQLIFKNIMLSSDLILNNFIICLPMRNIIWEKIFHKNFLKYKNHSRRVKKVRSRGERENFIFAVAKLLKITNHWIVS